VIFMPRGLADIFSGIRRQGPGYLLHNVRVHRL
jgi:hypothetical protein